jgi:hypothetical protein
MTTPRGDGRFEVPIERLSGGRGQGRRAGIVAIGLVTIVGGAFAIARLDDRTAAPPLPASPGLAVRTSPSSAPSRARSTSPRVEELPPIARVALPGAPETTLVERVGTGGTDLRVLVWTPDDARIRTIRVIPEVVDAGAASPPAPILAPDRRHVLLLGTSTTGALRLGDALLVDDAGATVWRGEGATPTAGGLWSADSRLVVVPGQPRKWDLIRLDREGRAADRTVELPGEIYLPYPIPRTWLTLSALEPRTVPLGFSTDGAWIYGGVISPDLGMLIGQFRVASDGSRVEPLADFHVGRSDGLVPRPGTIGTQVVDPTSGRIATFRNNSDTRGGPRTLEVRGPDSAFQYLVGGGVTLGAAWGSDGMLYTLSGASLLYPDAIELRRTGPDGMSGPALLATEPLTTGALIGVRDGYAVVALLATRPASAMELVAVDLSDPERVTALPLDPVVELLAATVDR